MSNPLVDIGRYAVRRLFADSRRSSDWLGLGSYGERGLFNGFGTTGRNRDLSYDKWGAALAYCVVEPVYRSVNIRSDGVGRMAWKLVGKNGDLIDKSTNPDPKHPFAIAIQKGWERYSEGLIKLWSQSLLLGGENYMERVLALDGYHTADLRWLNPLGMTINAPNGVIVAFMYSGRGGAHVYKPNQIAYDKWVNPQDDVHGYSPTLVALSKANIELNGDRTWAAYYRNNARPDTIVSPKPEFFANGEFDTGTLAALETSWRDTFKEVQNRWAAGVLPIPVDITTFEQPDFTKQIPLSDSAVSAIYRAFGVPQTLAGDTTAGPYQGNSDEVHQGFFRTVLRNDCEGIAQSINSTILPHFAYPIPVRFEFDYSAYKYIGSAEQNRMDYVQKQVDAGLMSLYDGQVEMGRTPDEALKGLYKIDGIPVPVEQMRGLWEGHFPKGATVNPQSNPIAVLPAPAPVTAPALPAMTVDSTAQARAAVTEPASNVERPAFVCLSLANDPTVATLIQGLQTTLTDAAIEWQSAPTLHLTLAYANDVSDSDLLQISQGIHLPDSIRLDFQGTGVFENGNERALVATVMHTEGLDDLQSSITEAFGLHSVALSEYSQSAQWKPHVTLAYLPAGAAVEPSLLIGSNATAHTLLVTRDNFQPFAKIEATQIGVRTALAWHETARLELSAWQKFALSGKLARRAFAPDQTRGDLADSLTARLAEVRDKDAIRVVFDEAFAALAVRTITITQATFEARFGALLDQARAGELSRSQWAGRVRELLKLAGFQAYSDGLADGGVQSEPDEADSVEIDRIRAEQSQYVSDLGRALYKSETELTEGQASVKPGMWFNKSIIPFYHAGLLSANRNALMEFAGTPGAKPCPECSSLFGQRHRLKDYERKRLRPREDGDSFGCKGFQCNHKLIVVRGKARGNWLADAPGKWSGE